MRPAPALFVALLVALPWTGCSEAPQAHPVARVLLVGVDGLDWAVLRPLLAAGRCPNLESLMRRGCFGRLGTFIPTLSPVLWTSIATGKSMQQHGITQFVDRQGRDFTSDRRACRALWNVADAYGLVSNVFGWWITWPVEPIQGVMVSGSSSSALIEDNWKPALLPGVEGQVHPPSLAAEVLALAAEAGGPDRVRQLARDKVFGAIPDGVLGAAEQHVVQQTLWSVQSDATFFAVARTLIPKHAADLNLVYLGGTDVVGHRFWRQYEPEAYRWHGDPEADAALADVIPNYYVWIDEMLGELMEAAGEGAVVLVVSDHGMHAVSVERPPKEGFMTGHHLDGAPGVFLAAGPGVRRQGGTDRYLRTGALAPLGRVVDVTPTVLALLGIPSGRDMLGRPLKEILEGAARDNANMPPVETHDEGFRPPSITAMPAEMRENFRDRFQALGYLSLEVDSDAESELVDPRAFEPDTASDPSDVGGGER